jgi:16S rRNA (cytosine1402-N4)-methyltransferase
VNTVPQFQHRTVLLQEAVDALAIEGGRADGVYVDGTFGRGGHSRAILSRLNAPGRLIAFDKDLQAIAAANAMADGLDAGHFSIEHEGFASMAAVLARRGITQVQGVLLDLGVSSPQIDDGTRGFSFRVDGPLDMRMDTTRGISAAEWLNSAAEQDIRGVIRDYGEERFAVQIAKKIVARRAERPFERTRELAALVADTIPYREKGQDPATRTFQAVRIFINQELAQLEQGLNAAMEILAPGGRLAVISFHSLEDRIVKRFMQGHARPDLGPDAPHARMPIKAVDLPQPRMQLFGKIKPSAAEVAENPRSRSAVLRVSEKLTPEIKPQTTSSKPA